MWRTKIWDILRWSQIEGLEPTPFDLPNIWDLTDQEIEEYITSKLRDDLDNASTFDKLNRVYGKCLEYLEKELFYSKQELSRFKSHKKFHSISDLVKFLRDTKSSKWRMNCVIAKVFQSLYDCDVEFNERVKEVQEKTQWVIDNKLIKPLRIFQSNEDELVWEEFFELSRGKIRKIPYKIKKRLKSTHSSVSKEIRDPKYVTIERTTDMYGLTFEVEKKEDILPLMQMVAGYVFKKGDYEVNNDKGMFSLEDVEDNSEISEEFRQRLLNGTTLRDKPESWDISDIKLVTPKQKNSGNKNMNIEIKFTVVKNQNEKGINMHGIYKYAQKLKERIRLEWFISNDYIEIVSAKFLESLPDILASNVWREENTWDDIYPYQKELFNDLRSSGYISSSNGLRNPHIKANIQQHLKDGLIQYFKSKLIPVHVNNGKKVYFSNKRALEISQQKLSGESLASLSE